MTTERYTVATTRGDIAVALHRNVGVNCAVLAVFVPGAPRDISLTRNITSVWESAVVGAVSRSDVAFITFNYLGVGESTGQMSDSSIASRREQVVAVIRYVRAIIRPPKLVLVGFSMGGHIVSTLAGKCQADGIVLITPAAYGSRAEPIRFGPRLTWELRRPRSWQHSPAFAQYRMFKGHKLLIAPRNDEVIPAEVTAIYAAHTDERFIWRPSGVGHRFLACVTAEDRSVTRQSIERVAAFIELCASGTSSQHRPSIEAEAAA